MIIKIILYFFSISICFSKVNLENLDLGNDIKITQKLYSNLEDEVIVKETYLKILESSSDNYKYIYFDELGVSFINKDSIKYFNFSNGNYFTNRNYYNDFDKPLSSYIYFIELQKSLESLTKSIAEQSIINGETESFYYTKQDIYVEDLNIYRSLTIEWSKNGFDSLIITKAASHEGENLPGMWEQVIFSRSKNNSIYFDLEKYIEFYNNRERLILEKKKSNDINLNSFNLNYILQGINTKDVEINELFKEIKYLLVYCWGSWCGPCKLNYKNAIKLSEKINSNFKFISLNCEISKKYSKLELNEYLKRKNIQFPVYFGCDILDYLKTEEYPNLLVFNRNLELISNFPGYVLDFSEYLEYLSQFD